MKRYLLDTNICIAILKKASNVAKAISQIKCLNVIFLR